MSTFPPPPVEGIDWSSLGFSVTDVNGHIECNYTAATGKWSSPRLIRSPNITIHGLSPGLNYGLQIFEGLRAYRTPANRIAIFRPAANATRMARSAAFLTIPPFPPGLFHQAVHAAIVANAAYVPAHGVPASLYIRPLIFGSGPQLSLAVPTEFTFCVYVVPVGGYHGAAGLGVDALVLEEYDRAAPKGSGAVKIGGNYAPVFRFSAAAKEEGFGITLHLDSKTRTEIDEFTTSGFVGVKVEEDKVIVIVPDSPNVIKSTTSDSVCEIAASFGWVVERRRIPYEELKELKEVIAVGTAAGLVPIRSISMRSRGEKFVYEASAASESYCSKLSATLKGIQQGTIEDTFGWLEYVEAPKDHLESE